jgi:hypothetical protein
MPVLRSARPVSGIDQPVLSRSRPFVELTADPRASHPRLDAAERKSTGPSAKPASGGHLLVSPTRSGRGAHLATPSRKVDPMNEDKKADNSRLTLPFGAAHQYGVMVNACKQQVATIQKCADYPTEPEVQTRALATLAGADALAQTVVDLGAARLLVSTLEGQREQQAVALRSHHAALVGTLNVACKGKVANIKAWGGDVASRTVLPASTDPPINPGVTTTATTGSVLAKCRADRGAIGYLFQHGGDPANPDAWPKAELVATSKLTVTGLPVGQKVYFRIAVVRRRGGQGQWSGVMEVTVR